MKVLVTAFNKFGKSDNNYSEEVIKYINNVNKIILDVVYDECYQYLISKYDLKEYDLVIALGEARMRSDLMIEAQAVNLSSCSLPDNSGILKRDSIIIDGENEVLKTEVDIAKCDDIVGISYDAGKFVCNNLYFHLLANYPKKSIFIHVPNCENSIEKYEENARIIESIIERLSL